MTTSRQALAKHTLVQHQNYARFRDLALVMRKKELVRYNRETHSYEDCIHAATRRVSLKERQTVTLFLKLQRNIAQQAMLLLELEHAIEHEEENENIHR